MIWSLNRLWKKSVLTKIVKATKISKTMPKEAPTDSPANHDTIRRNGQREGDFGSFGSSEFKPLNYQFHQHLPLKEVSNSSLANLFVAE